PGPGLGARPPAPVAPRTLRRDGQAIAPARRVHSGGDDASAVAGAALPRGTAAQAKSGRLGARGVLALAGRRQAGLRAAPATWRAAGHRGGAAGGGGGVAGGHPPSVSKKPP